MQHALVNIRSDDYDPVTKKSRFPHP